MGEAGSRTFVSKMSHLLTRDADWLSRRVATTMLVGLFLASCHGAFAQDFGELAMPGSWEPSDTTGRNNLGGIFPDRLRPDGGSTAPSGSAPGNFYGPTAETSGDVAARLFPALSDPVGHASEGFQRVHGVVGSTGDFVESVADVPSSFSGVSNGTFSNGSLGLNGNLGGVPGLGRGPFAALGNLFQGGNGGMMNSLLQGLAFFSMLQDLLAGFLNGDGQFNPANTGQSAFIANANLRSLDAGPSDSVPIQAPFQAAFNQCAPGCTYTSWGIWGDERHQARASCHNSGSAIDIHDITCNGQTMSPGSSGFQNFVGCMSSDPSLYVIHGNAEHTQHAHIALRSCEEGGIGKYAVS